jgi:hypothetical protein
MLGFLVVCALITAVCLWYVNRQDNRDRIFDQRRIVEKSLRRPPKKL